MLILNNLTYVLLTEEYLKADPRELMAKHGKSFYFASMIFSKARLLKIATLYRLCRFIDDCADELPDLESQTAIKSILDDLNNEANDTKFNQLVAEVVSWGVERSYIKELVIGAQFDAQGGKISTSADLMLYCYRVAGVVGLMMCPLIGVKDKKGHPHAIDLGLGMQLTNICRDVLQDAHMNRIYLPEDQVTESGLSISELQKAETPKELSLLVHKTLDQADQYYLSGYSGLAYIPFRPRVVILLAGEIYRHIGIKIRKNNCQVLSGRTYLSFTEKILVTFKTMGKLISLCFWKPQNHTSSLHTLINELPGTNS